MLERLAIECLSAPSGYKVFVRQKLGFTNAPALLGDLVHRWVVSEVRIYVGGAWVGSSSLALGGIPGSPDLS